MRILAVLVILPNLNLHQHSSQHRPSLRLLRLRALIIRLIVRLPVHGAHAAKVDVHPPPRLLELHHAPLLQVVVARAGQEGELGGRVALVEVEVEVDPNAGNLDQFEEVDV